MTKPITPRNGGTNRDYDVGYGKPPVATRFQKGNKGGNRKGRRKDEGADDIATVFESTSQDTISITQNGKSQKVSKLEALFRRQAFDAIKGDTRAARLLLERALKYGLSKKTVQESFIKIMEPGGELGEMLRIYLRGNLSLRRATPGSPHG